MAPTGGATASPGQEDNLLSSCFETPGNKLASLEVTYFGYKRGLGVSGGTSIAAIEANASR